MYFADESFDESDIGRKFDCFYFSHEVSVVIIVAVVVAQHTSVISGTSSQVDVREIVGNDLSVFEPDLLF
jgi:hypothetical protein